jgi:CTD small phosphatase-like protein 2
MAVYKGPMTLAAKCEAATGFLLPALNSSARRAGQKREYTLVLDLDETLVHCEKQFSNFKVRPHAQQFLVEMNKHFEVVIFTAGMPDYADWVLNDLDYRSKLINYRLYRDSCTYVNGFFFKDLRRLGRDLSKTIIVDNVATNFYLQQGNGI